MLYNVIVLVCIIIVLILTVPCSENFLGSQAASNTCPSSCQQVLASLTDQCKVEINAAATQQNAGLNLISLSALCQTAGASLRISPAHLITVAVAVALAQLA